MRPHSNCQILSTAALMLSLSFCPVIALPSLACKTSNPLAQAGEAIPLFDNLGNFNYSIATNSETAQKYFNQGMTLAYGFNHAEAARSFQESIREDSTCAMCHWGLAYVLGPNINAPMRSEAVPIAWESIQKAQSLSENATKKEQALIQAMAARYSPDPEADREVLNRGYAEAMRAVHQQYPDDPNIATLFAEALMDTMPWDYWDESGNPRPETEVILTTLENVIEHYPKHMGALHFYIHAVEKERPDLGEAAADTLRDLVPGAGHLVHMPSHIYIRIGRYHDAVMVNENAIAADNTYLQGSYVPSIYTLAYVPHNHHFKWFGALMTGQSKVALAAANQTAQVDQEMLQDPDLGASLQHYYSVPLFTLVRFALWDEILATPAPEKNLKYPTGIWHYAEGMALAAQGKTSSAREHLAQLAILVEDPEMKEQRIWGFNTFSQVLGIAKSVLAGEIALADQNDDEAITNFQEAVALENQLVYTEPPDWYSPTKNLLGRTLLQTGRYREAEAAFQEDLAAYPQNGWSLYGLTQSLQAQGKSKEAAVAKASFEEAWQYADTSINW